jgi:hypothetical protein
MWNDSASHAYLHGLARGALRSRRTIALRGSEW